MAGTNGGPVPGLFDEQIVYAALDAIEQALEQALTARTEIQQRWQLNQLRGLLLTLPSSGLSLDDSLRQLIRLLRTPMMNRQTREVPRSDRSLETEERLASASRGTAVPHVEPSRRSPDKHAPVQVRGPDGVLDGDDGPPPVPGASATSSNWYSSTADGPPR